MYVLSNDQLALMDVAHAHYAVETHTGAGDAFDWTHAVQLFYVKREVAGAWTTDTLPAGWYLLHYAGPDGRDVTGQSVTEAEGRDIVAATEAAHETWQESAGDGGDPDYAGDLYDHTPQGMTDALWSDMR